MTLFVNNNTTASPGGEALLNGKTLVSFVILVSQGTTAETTGTFGISLSTGYENDGTLLSGGVLVR